MCDWDLYQGPLQWDDATRFGAFFLTSPKHRARFWKVGLSIYTPGERFGFSLDCLNVYLLQIYLLHVCDILCISSMHIHELGEMSY